MNIQYVGALFNSSGYAEAARNNVCALLTQPNISLSLKTISFENWVTDIGHLADDFAPLLKKNQKVDVNLVHLTPENFPRHRVEGAKNIGITVWETTKLPAGWTQLCNLMDEIWVPCDWNVEVFRSSGVNKPVRKLPHCMNLNVFNTFDIEQISSIDQSVYNFYSIFQWSSRKNPDGLIAAYLSEFKPSEKVCLILKTYTMDSSYPDKVGTINKINQVKYDLQLQDTPTPPIVLIHGALSRRQMFSLHKQCDCFVLPHRAEGWGVPHFEAMAVGNPVITTGFSGNLEFMNGKSSYLCDFSMTPVKGMGRPTYNGLMDWAEPNISNLRYLMRYVFEHQEEAKQKADYGREFIKKFDLPTVGKQIVEML